MERVVKALFMGQNALLESPTGTGKTLCLLCASLAWLLHQKGGSVYRKVDSLQNMPSHLANPSIPNSHGGVGPADIITAEKRRIIYAARTHSQLTQVVKELHKTAYGARIRVLAGRAHLCLNPAVRSKPRGTQRSECAKLISERHCPWRTNLDSFLAREGKQIDDEMLDIEDLITRASSSRVCPYYWSRTGLEKADLILVPYQYIMDPVACASVGLEPLLEGAVILFDEAHNLESTCTESASSSLPVSLLTMALGEMGAIIDKMASKKEAKVAIDLVHQVPDPDPVDCGFGENNITSSDAENINPRNAVVDTFNPENVYLRTELPGKDAPKKEFTFDKETVERMSNAVQDLRKELIDIFTSPPPSTRNVLQPNPNQNSDSALPDKPKLAQLSGSYIAYDNCKGSNFNPSSTKLDGVVLYGSWMYNVLFRRLIFDREYYLWSGYDCSVHPLTLQQANEKLFQELGLAQPEKMQWIWSDKKDNIRALPPYRHVIGKINEFLKYLEVLGNWYIFGDSSATAPVSGETIPTTAEDIETEQDLDTLLSPSAPSNEPKSTVMTCNILQLCELFKSLFIRPLSDMYTQQLNYFYRCYVDYSPEFSGVPQHNSYQRKLPTVDDIVLNFWCFSSSVTMNQLIAKRVRSVVLTSGTLSPLGSYQSEMGILFDQILENDHVINKKQILLSIIKAGPGGSKLTSSFKSRSDEKVIAELGMTLVNIAKRLRGYGMLVFYPSYALMQNSLRAWKLSNLSDLDQKPTTTGYVDGSVLHGLSQQHTVYFESRDGGAADLDSIIERKTIEMNDKKIKAQIAMGIDPTKADKETKKAKFGSGQTLNSFFRPGGNSKGSGWSTRKNDIYGGARDPVARANFREQRMQFTDSMQEYSQKIQAAQKIIQANPVGYDKTDEATKGSMLFGICRGKASEGIDFSDDQARAVVITGIPYSAAFEPRVVLKKHILDSVITSQLDELKKIDQVLQRFSDRSSPAYRGQLHRRQHLEHTKQMSGQTWYTQTAMRAVNQAVGRVIRHRFDYGAVILADERFAQPGNQQLLAKWLRSEVREFEQFKDFYPIFIRFLNEAPKLAEGLKKENDIKMEFQRLQYAKETDNYLTSSHVHVEVEDKHKPVEVTGRSRWLMNPINPPSGGHVNPTEASVDLMSDYNATNAGNIAMKRRFDDFPHNQTQNSHNPSDIPQARVSLHRPSTASVSNSKMGIDDEIPSKSRSINEKLLLQEATHRRAWGQISWPAMQLYLSHEENATLSPITNELMTTHKKLTTAIANNSGPVVIDPLREKLNKITNIYAETLLRLPEVMFLQRHPLPPLVTTGFKSAATSSTPDFSDFINTYVKSLQLHPLFLISHSHHINPALVFSLPPSPFFSSPPQPPPTAPEDLQKQYTAQIRTIIASIQQHSHQLPNSTPVVKFSDQDLIRIANIYRSPINFTTAMDHAREVRGVTSSFATLPPHLESLPLPSTSNPLTATITTLSLPPNMSDPGSQPSRHFYGLGFSLPITDMTTLLHCALPRYFFITATLLSLPHDLYQALRDSLSARFVALTQNSNARDITVLQQATSCTILPKPWHIDVIPQMRLFRPWLLQWAQYASDINITAAVSEVYRMNWMFYQAVLGCVQKFLVTGTNGTGTTFNSDTFMKWAGQVMIRPLKADKLHKHPQQQQQQQQQQPPQQPQQQQPQQQQPQQQPQQQQPQQQQQLSNSSPILQTDSSGSQITATHTINIHLDSSVTTSSTPTTTSVPMFTSASASTSSCFASPDPPPTPNPANNLDKSPTPSTSIFATSSSSVDLTAHGLRDAMKANLSKAIMTEFNAILEVFKGFKAVNPVVFPTTIEPSDNPETSELQKRLLALKDRLTSFVQRLQTDAPNFPPEYLTMLLQRFSLFTEPNCFKTYYNRFIGPTLIPQNPQ